MLQIVVLVNERYHHFRNIFHIGLPGAYMFQRELRKPQLISMCVFLHVSTEQD